MIGFRAINLFDAEFDFACNGKNSIQVYRGRENTPISLPPQPRLTAGIELFSAANSPAYRICDSARPD